MIPHRFLLCALGFLVSAAPACATTSVGAIHVDGERNRTRIVLSVDEKPHFRTAYLAEPDRLIVDFARTRFELDRPDPRPTGLVKALRYGEIGQDKARVVVDLSGPAMIARRLFLPASDAEPPRLVIDLAPVGRPTFAALVRLQTPEGLPPDSPPIAEPANRPVVVIDPGHGGVDAGAVGVGEALEKDVTLAFCLALREELERRGIVKPVLTRDDDSFLSLAARVAMARANRADLFISVHADTVAQDYVRGATVYTLSKKASDQVAARLAQRENRSDLEAGLRIEDQPTEVADILIDLARRETSRRSARFAGRLVSDLQQSVMLNKTPRRGGAFQVLMAPEVPSVLLELGYLSNESDEQLLRSNTWQAMAVAAVADAIEKFFAPH